MCRKDSRLLVDIPSFARLRGGMLRSIKTIDTYTRSILAAAYLNVGGMLITGFYFSRAVGIEAMAEHSKSRVDTSYKTTSEANSPNIPP